MKVDKLLNLLSLVLLATSGAHADNRRPESCPADHLETSSAILGIADSPEPYLYLTKIEI